MSAPTVSRAALAAGHYSWMVGLVPVTAIELRKLWRGAVRP